MALPGVLLLSAFLVAITGWLVGHVSADLAMAGAVEREGQIDALAEATLQTAATALGGVADWRTIGAMSLPLACPPPARVVASVVPADERARVQARMASGSRWGADTPAFETAWVCHAELVLGRWTEPGPVPAVMVFVGDDPEGDGRPDLDTNDRLLLQAVVVGAGRTRSGASAAVTRAAPGGPVSLVAFRTE